VLDSAKLGASVGVLIPGGEHMRMNAADRFDSIIGQSVEGVISAHSTSRSGPSFVCKNELVQSSHDSDKGTS
jgi:hypothetical protein